MNRPVKLAIIGDPHLAVPQGADDQLLEIDPGRKLHGLSVELLEAVVAGVNAEPDVTAAIVLGDLTRDSEDFNHLRATAVLSTLNIPYYLVLGNHDLGLERGGVVDRIYPGSKRLNRAEMVEFYLGQGIPGASSYYSVELPGLLLIVLDSTLSPEDRAVCGIEGVGPDDGWIEPAQLNWLEQQLAGAPQRGLLPLVAMHHSSMDHSPAERQGHPLRRTLQFWQLRNAAELNDLLRRYQVPLLLSGHLHAQCVNCEQGLVNLVSSATVSYPHSWRLLRFESDSIEVESRPISSIPSCVDLQSCSRDWMAEGMTSVIVSKLREIGPLARHVDALGEMVTRSQWWPRFSSGTLAGFKVDAGIIPKTDFVSNLLTQQIVQILNAFGDWQDARPDPNTLSIPLDLEQRRAALEPKS